MKNNKIDMVRNPFITSGYVGSEYFCDRVTETASLTKLLVNGNNVVLVSPRRLGKTGLLHHCFQQEEIASQYNTFIIDIYSTKNLNDFVLEMGKSILNSLKSKSRKLLEKFVDVVSSVRSGVSFDVMGNPSWSVDFGMLPTPDCTLEQIFNFIEQSDKPCIIAIDEFQQIMNYPEKNVEATLRTYIQRCHNAVFVFSGSEQHLLSEMFSSPSRPFYASTSTQVLEPLPIEKYAQFAQHHFDSRGKALEEGVAEEVYKLFNGVTWFVQKTMNYLFADTDRGMTCTHEMIAPAIDEIVRDNSVIYTELLYQLTSRQKELLMAINNEGKVGAITGSGFIRKYHLPSASTIQTTIKALVDKQIVTRHQGEYEVYDKFFSLWLKVI